MQAIIQYFKDSVAEFNNITWPTKKQAVRISVIVLVFMAVSAAVLGALDQVLTVGYQALLKINL